MRPCIKEGYAAPGRPASKYFDQNRRLLPSFYDPHRKFALRANRYKSAAGALKTNCLGMNQIFGSNAEVKPFGHIRGRRIVRARQLRDEGAAGSHRARMGDRFPATQAHELWIHAQSAMKDLPARPGRIPSRASRRQGPRRVRIRRGNAGQCSRGPWRVFLVDALACVGAFNRRVVLRDYKTCLG